MPLHCQFSFGDLANFSPQFIKKNICNFWQRSGSNPGRRIRSQTLYWLRHWASDGSSAFMVDNISNISVNSGQIWFKNAHAVNTFTLVLFISKMRFNLDYKIDRYIILWFSVFFWTPMCTRGKNYLKNWKNTFWDIQAVAKKLALDKERFVLTLYGFFSKQKNRSCFLCIPGVVGVQMGSRWGRGWFAFGSPTPRPHLDPIWNPHAPQKTEKTRSVFCF